MVSTELIKIFFTARSLTETGTQQKSVLTKYAHEGNIL